jgi:hypothetical protein
MMLVLKPFLAPLLMVGSTLPGRSASAARGQRDQELTAPGIDARGHR